MSNLNKDHSSDRGHNTNMSEFEQSAANKKKNAGSDIFGYNKDTVEPTQTKQSRNAGNNNIGGGQQQQAQPSSHSSAAEDAHTKAGAYAEQYKQTQMKSSIFESNEPATSRHVSDKNKSNIFGIGDNNDQKRQTQVRQGVRDPNASRMGYNPINGEAYSAKGNGNDKQPDSTVKAVEEENGHGQVAPADNAENGNSKKPAENNENGNSKKPADNLDNGNNAQKNVHTSVRVVHPPGGKSNGPLW